MKILQIGKRSFISFSLSLVLFSDSVVHWHRHCSSSNFFSVDLEMALFVPTYFFGFVMTTYGIPIALMLRKEIRALFGQLDKIYETSETNFFFIQLIL